MLISGQRICKPSVRQRSIEKLEARGVQLAEREKTIGPILQWQHREQTRTENRCKGELAP